METIPLWPILTYRFDWDEHSFYQPGLKKLCDDLSETQRTSNIADGSKSRLYESPFNFAHADDPAVRAWTDWIKKCVFEAARKASGTEWPPGINLMLELHESWCHVTENGGFHDRHMHPNSCWSGIYYLDCADMRAGTINGVNRFYRPWDTAYLDAGTVWTRNNYVDIQASAGMLYLFPSWIDHAALPYFGERKRYVLSFNCQIKLIKPAAADA